MASANLLSATGLIATLSSSVAGLFAFKLTKELSRRGVDRRRVLNVAQSTAASTAQLTVRGAITFGIALAYAIASLVCSERWECIVVCTLRAPSSTFIKQRSAPRVLSVATSRSLSAGLVTRMGAHTLGRVGLARGGAHFAPQARPRGRIAALPPTRSVEHDVRAGCGCCRHSACRGTRGTRGALHTDTRTSGEHPSTCFRRGCGGFGEWSDGQR